MTKKNLETLMKYSLLGLCSYLAIKNMSSFADISIGGTDNSAQMKDVQNFMTTIQSIGFKWVARLIGGFLVVSGIYKIASREFVMGFIATGCGGALFFVEKIADSLSKMAGSS